MSFCSFFYIHSLSFSWSLGHLLGIQDIPVLLEIKFLVEAAWSANCHHDPAHKQGDPVALPDTQRWSQCIGALNPILSGCSEEIKGTQSPEAELVQGWNSLFPCFQRAPAAAKGFYSSLVHRTQQRNMETSFIQKMHRLYLSELPCLQQLPPRQVRSLVSL